MMIKDSRRRFWREWKDDETHWNVTAAGGTVCEAAINFKDFTDATTAKTVALSLSVAK